MEDIVLRVLEGGVEGALALLFILVAYKCYKTSYKSECKTKLCKTIIEDDEG